MRIILSAVLLAVVPQIAAAQLVYVEFKDAKVAKRYAKNLTTYRGREVVIGEPKAGIKCETGKVNYTGGAEAKNVLYVGNPADPGFCPYKWENGERVKNGKQSELSFAGSDITRISYVDQLQTLAGLADEYLRRKAELDEIERTRDAQGKATREWFNAHGRLLGRYDSLESWLINVGYPDAAKKLHRAADKERKVAAKEATALREQTALGSIKQVPTPERLVEVAAEFAPGRKFSVVESQHVRLVYLQELGDNRAQQLIELAEKVIEAFRKEFVDPHLGEDFDEAIPDKIFQEFYFGPEDLTAHENVLTKYYRGTWQNPKERSLASGGTRRRVAGLYIDYWKLSEQNDLEGIITHGLGHNLCDIHFNRGRGGAQDWLEEAVGYYVSFAFLGRNSVTCFNWAERRYDAPAPKEGEKTVQSGLRGAFNDMAIKQGPTIEALAVKSLTEITDVDFAKAWSFFDWVATTQGKVGQKWLRATCLAASDRGKFIQRWRKISEEAFGVETGTDVFGVLEQRWREFAESTQQR